MRIPAGDRFVAFLGYILFLGLIIAKWVKRDSLFVQFHARQGALLFSMWALFVLVVVFPLLFIFQEGWPNSAVFLLLALSTLAYALFTVIGLVKVLAGERYRMPVVADLALKMNL